VLVKCVTCQWDPFPQRASVSIVRHVNPDLLRLSRLERRIKRLANVSGNWTRLTRPKTDNGCMSGHFEHVLVHARKPKLEATAGVCFDASARTLRFNSER